MHIFYIYSAVAAVITAVFTTTLAISLTSQAANAVYSNNGACASNSGGISSATVPNKAGSASGINSSHKPFTVSNARSAPNTGNAFVGSVNCGGNPGVIKNGKQLCSG